MPRRRKRLSSSTEARNPNKAMRSQNMTTGQRIKSFLLRRLYGRVRERVAFTLLLTIGFVSVALHYPRGRAHALDVVVVSLLYGAWFAMGVPKLLSYLSPAFVSQAIDVTVKVFFADALVLTYALYRGHANLLFKPTTSDGPSPVLDGSTKAGWDLGWLGHVGYNLRMATIASCGLISIVSHVLDYLQRRM
ncbi:uncharacterized protein LOC112575562 [Pomacea canaliculata]|nr:uncharacterized protein LOC112575562 [Pomacea canaliculata]